MKIMVTGGSGFIGRNLVSHFSRSHDVLAPTHAELDLTNDQAVDDWFRCNDVEVVIHGAVRPGNRAAADPTRQLWCNLRMYFNLLRKASHFRRLILLSSGAVYDTSRNLARVREEQIGESLPSDEYGLSKYAIAQHSTLLAASGSAEVVELRLFGVFGRYEDYGIRFISNAICRALCGLPITLSQNRRFSYLYVDDLSRVVEWVLSAPVESTALNVVPDWIDDLAELGKMVAYLTGVSAPVAACPGFGREYSGSNAQLRLEMPHVSFTPTVAAVRELVDWYRQRLPDIDRGRLEVPQ